MPCFHPWVLPAKDKATGKPLIGVPGTRLPCGQCIGCRLDRAREWATRIHHEAAMHKASSLITLTYSNEHLPSNYSLDKREMQLFFKRLRKLLWQQGGFKVRYYLCGEYGDKNLRPHYHIILFGYDFPDRYVWRKTGSGHLQYRSPLLEPVWPYGHAEIGTVTIDSAGYVARYVTKKITGDQADQHYERMHPLTGEIWRVIPEFSLQSTRPGIGASWFHQFPTDPFPDDFVTVNGEKRPVPRYYKRLFDRGQSSLVPGVRIAWGRKVRAEKHADNNTEERLLVREELQQLKAARLLRELDDEQ